MEHPNVSLERRSFLKGSAVCGLSAAAAGIGLPFAIQSEAKATGQPAGSAAPKANETLVWNACLVNCGGRCPLQCHVVNGVVTSISTDHSGADELGDHQVRACLRGRSAKHRIYAPDRLKYPMKRVGKRGEAKFERISWDEAFKLVGEALKKTINQYGNEAIYYNYGSGTTGYNIGGRRSCHRFLRTIGGYLDYYGTYSTAQLERAMPLMYGSTEVTDRSLSREMANAKLIVNFGYNPANTRMSGGGETYLYSEYRRRNKVRTIVIDPRYSDTAMSADEWIPIRPGTDAALVEAIAYVLITEKMVDEPFLLKYCVGYDEKTLPASAPKNGHYKAHIMGEGPDQIVKTPEWASRITGIPVDKIVKLAREIGQTKPTYITQGWSLQRQANGEQSVRAICMLPLLTGNIGLPGTNLGDEPHSYVHPVPAFPIPDNKVKVKIPVFLWTDAITRGKEMTALADGIQGADKLNQPIKFFFNYSSNTVINQHSDTTTTHKILQDESLCEFILVIDTHMTASARYADVLLPDVTNFENSDIINNSYASGEIGGVLMLSPAIPPMFECKNMYDICTGIAKYMGQEEAFTGGKTYAQWLEIIYAQLQEKDPKLPPLEEARKIGMIKRRAPLGTGIGLEKFRADPTANPLKTPSGKIEIYSEQLATIAATWTLPEGDVITPLPQYVATWESSEDKETQKQYPLQLFGFHPRGRTHSTYHNVPALRAALTDNVWINPIDAAMRGIKNGDKVKVTSKRGEIRIIAHVTPRIMPGVAAMGEGAWYQPDAKGVDHGGCINTLTTHRPSPLAKGNPQHTNLVDIAKV